MKRFTCAGLGLTCLAVLLTHAAAQGPAKPPAPPAAGAGGVFVLDDCDPEYKGKQKYADNLSYVDAAGKLVFRVSGLNGCQSIGSSRLIAVDHRRGSIWLVEMVGRTVRKYDRTGKELLVLKDIHASALAVDPDTGNVWVVTTQGRIQGEKTVVFAPNGKRLATHDLSGWDIAYDRKGKAFWIAGPNLSRIGLDGSTVVVEGIAVWCASSVAVHPATGKVWVAVRRHRDVNGSSNELLAFDNDGKVAKRIELGDEVPFRVSLDPKDGAVWVTLMRHSVRRYSAAGKKEAEHKLPALTCQAAADGGVWVATGEEIIRLDARGAVKVRVKHKSKTTQAWIAGG